MNNTYDEFTDVSGQEYTFIIDRKQEYIYWLEKGWWTANEAICVFSGQSPDEVDDLKYFRPYLLSEREKRVCKLVSAAVRDKSIKNHVIEPQFLSNRAPCKDWLEWAMNKPSISVDPELLIAAGITEVDNSRTNESYRPKDEIMLKFNFISIAKIVLYLCPNARLGDIQRLIEKTSAIDNLPGKRTLRDWIKNSGLSLFAERQTRQAIEEIDQKLSPLLQSLKQNNP